MQKLDNPAKIDLASSFYRNDQNVFQMSCNSPCFRSQKRSLKTAIFKCINRTIAICTQSLYKSHLGVFPLICIAFAICIVYPARLNAQSATMRIHSATSYQKITGFGGFVCSGTFQYNHMSAAEIKKMWGKTSEAGYNIMRLYIPESESSWGNTLATAQLAKSLGILIFASPWTMPVEWKTYQVISAIYTDASGVQHDNYLKEEYYDAYANYLNKYVTYLRNNGVELDAISIQNEPDMRSTYHGCIWTPAQMANFIKNYSHLINCRIIAAEGTGITDNYSNALLDPTVINHFDIFGGHQYNAVQSAHKQFLSKGKEVWMTEYLINWNSDKNTTRNFIWSIDAFNFANKVNEVLMSNVSAWIHYATKRFYGLMGDGSYGTTNSALTKRGYILSHFAKHLIGSTRIEHSFLDDTGQLNGSSYLSASGDSVIVMIINPSSNIYHLTVDLPFYTTSGSAKVTTEFQNMSPSALLFSEETYRPKVSIGASSFTTLVFLKCNDRPVSRMTGQSMHNNPIEQQQPNLPAFGTGYMLSHTTVTFDNSHMLISTNKTLNNGYLKMDDRYNQLVFHIDSVHSAMNYISSNTTLHYINQNGNVSSYNYGTLNLNQNGDFDWILDISPKVLTDGCKGILGLSNTNYSSILTLKFGDVYFRLGNEKAYGFKGIYSHGDSDLLDCMEDNTYTSIDFTGVSQITSDLHWNSMASNKNCLYYTSDEVINSHPNVIAGNSCSQLSLSDEGKNFYVPAPFYATQATYTATIKGYEMLVLPFEASVPSGTIAYLVNMSGSQVNCTRMPGLTLPAHTPVLIAGNGTFTFSGSGEVSTPHALTVNKMNCVYVSVMAPAHSYYLTTVDGVAGFYRVTSGTEASIPPFSAYWAADNSITSPLLPLNLEGLGLIKNGIRIPPMEDAKYYDLFGRVIQHPQKGVIYIKNGKKVVF